MLKKKINISAKEFAKRFRVILTEDQLNLVLADAFASPEIVIDVETYSGLDIVKPSLAGIAIYTKTTGDWFIPFGWFSKLNTHQVCKKIAVHMRIYEGLVIGHNYKFDMEVLKFYGIPYPKNIYDTLIAMWMLNENQKLSLKVLAKKYLDSSWGTFDSLFDDKKLKRKTKKDLSKVPLWKVATYARGDVKGTYGLWEYSRPLLDKEKFMQIFNKVEMPIVKILADMELEGIKLDLKAMKKQKLLAEKLISESMLRIWQMSGKKINLNSPDQLVKLLYDDMDLPILNYTKGGKKGIKKPSTGVKTLKALAGQGYEIARELLNYRKITKTLNSFIVKLPKHCDENGKIHTSILQVGTRTGRFASAKPNIQNVKRNEGDEEDQFNLRDMFVAEEGDELIIIDLSNAELRVMAHFSGDEKMLDAFEKDIDLHIRTASFVFEVPEKKVDKELRRKAKTVQFGIIYGITEHGLSEQLNCSKEEAKSLIEKYYQLYTGVFEWTQLQMEKARKFGYVRTLLGRKRRLPEINALANLSDDASEKERRFAWGLERRAERQASNAPIQGTVSDLVKLAMVKLKKKGVIDKNCKLLLQVHDELVFSCKKSLVEKKKKEIKDIVENPFDRPIKEVLKLELKADISNGKNWGAKS